MEGQEIDVPFSAQGSDTSDTITATHGTFELPQGELERVPLGRLFATRSGDKGGNANLGVWGKTEQEFAFLQQVLTIDKLKELLPDLDAFQIDRHELPNLFALNFYVHGVLGEGVAASLRSDPQAKTLGEYLRAKMIDVPSSLIKEIGC